MKTAKRENKFLSPYSMTGQLLIDVFNAIDYVFPLDMQPTMIWKFGYEGTRRIRDAQEKKIRHQALKRLEKKKLISIQKKADCYEIALTEEGESQAFWLKAQEAGFHKMEHVCMVVFDVPESQRKLRKRIRYFLYEIGFIPIQRSVWVSPYDVANDLINLFRSVKVDRWVRVYNAQEVRAK
jgi:phenylacetic acid degradation operon negative regulatory protein